uniref:Uncharacterized protein n=1 Tax=Anguilla anguilla TaxID=7936 RepID=A0A0E9VW67_ANGAN
MGRQCMSTLLLPICQVSQI